MLEFSSNVTVIVDENDNSFPILDVNKVVFISHSVYTFRKGMDQIIYTSSYG